MREGQGGSSEMCREEVEGSIRAGRSARRSRSASIAAALFWSPACLDIGFSGNQTARKLCCSWNARGLWLLACRCEVATLVPCSCRLLSYVPVLPESALSTIRAKATCHAIARARAGRAPGFVALGYLNRVRCFGVLNESTPASKRALHWGHDGDVYGVEHE